MNCPTRLPSKFLLSFKIAIRCILIILFLAFVNLLKGQTISSSGGGTGNWNDPLSWTPNTVPTSANSTSIVINSGHTINYDAAVTGGVDQITDNGTIIINSGVIMTLANGSLDEITVSSTGVLTINGTLAFTTGIPPRTVLVNGTLNNNGSLTNVSLSKLTFGSTSNYFHQFTNGGTIPAATWNVNSTVNIVGYTGLNSTPPSGLLQSFGHFVWNAPGQGATISLGALPTTINGDFRVESTGSDALFYSMGGAGSTMNIGGNFDINGGTVGWASGDAAASTLNVTGNIDVSGGSYVQFADDQNLTINLTGNFVLSGTAQIDFSATTATTNLNIQGNYTHSGGSVFASTGTGNFNFTGASTKIFTSQLTPSGSVNYSVASLSTLTVSGANYVGGTGTFTLNGTLQVGSTDVGGALQTGTASGNLRVSGTRTFATNSSIVYNGIGAQFIGSGFPSGSDVNLTINNSSGVTLSTSLDIVALRTLTLSSGNISIGAQTLTINGTVSGSGGIVGGASSNLVIGGTGDFGILTFSGTNQLQNFTLNRTGGSGLVTLGGSLSILGTFTHTTGVLAVGANTFTLSGAYGPTLPDDLSTTSASTIIINGAGTLPSDVGFVGAALGTLTLARTSVTLPTTSTIEITNLNLNAGTFSNGAGITITTGGTITRVGGSMSTSPGNTTNAYNVVYTSGAITTGSELPSNTTALANLSKTGTGTVTLGSNITINGILTLSNGTFNAGTNTIDLKGNFVSSAASTLTSSPITFSGTTTVSGGSVPTFGAITVSGSSTLTPSSSFQINGNLTNNGVLNSGSATVTFGGTTTISGSSISSFNNVTINSSSSLTAPAGNFNVAGIWTNNGTFNRGADTNTVTFTGTNSITGSSSTTFSGITISAVGTLTSPATLNLAGNFTNNGTFINNSGTVVFNGTAQQDIQGSSLTNFNNISVTNTASPISVSVASNQDLTGTLTLAANTTFDADGAGGLIVFRLRSTGDSPTVDASIATIPTGATITGSVTVQRFMAIEAGPSGNNRIYRNISSPVSAAAVSQIQPMIPVTGSFTGESTCCPGATQSMFAYDETVITGDLNAGYIDFPATANTETLATARGYNLFVRGNVAPVSTAGSALFELRGPVNIAPIATPLSFPVSFTSSGTVANDGWNLVGNPFPATIDWNAASGWAKGAGITGTIYMRDNGGNPTRVATWNGSVGTNGGSRNIGIGQAFWVKSDGGGATTLTADERVKVGGTQTTFFREGGISDVLRITLRKGSSYDESVVHFRSDATPGFDKQADAYKLKNSTVNLSTLADTTKLAINSLPLLSCGTTVKINLSDVSPGSYSLDFSEFETFSESVIISLHDALDNTTISVRQKSSYPFNVTSDATTFGSNRFSLTFKYSLPTSMEVENQKMACMGEESSVSILNSNVNNVYSILKNGQVIVSGLEGNGSTLLLNIPGSKLEAGVNSIDVVTSLKDCSTVSFTRSIQVTVENKPSLIAESVGRCNTGKVTLLASGGSDGNYRWYESETSQVSITGASAGTFITQELIKTKTYYVSAVNSLGCEGVRIPVMAAINYPIEIQKVIGASHCKAGSVTLEATGGTDGQYRWYESATVTNSITGQLSSKWVTPTLTETKTYYVSLVNEKGCEGIRMPVVATIANYENATVTVIDNKLISNFEIGNQWYLNGQMIPGATGREYSFKESGVYKLEVKVGDCITSAEREMLVTGLEDGTSSILTIYPNPVLDIFIVEVRTTNKVVVEITNLLGVLVMGEELKKLDGGVSRGEFDMSAESAGIYLVKIVDGDTIHATKIIKK